MDTLFWVPIFTTIEGYDRADSWLGSDPLVLAQLKEALGRTKEAQLRLIKKE